MFSNSDLASEVYDSLLEARKTLANSVASIKGRCSDEEYRHYRKLIGDALGLLITDGMDVILDRHPELKKKYEGQ
jgi:hypothetical protein